MQKPAQENIEPGENTSDSESAWRMPDVPIINAIEDVRRKLQYTDGHLSPKPSGESLLAFQNIAYTNNVENLKTKIRNACGYDIGKNGEMITYTGNRPQAMIEKTLAILEKSYGDVRRKNGDLAVVHALQAMEVIAAVNAPEKPGDRVSVLEIVDSGLHDIMEDAADSRNRMYDVAFRANEVHWKVELREPAKIREYVKKIYNVYGKYYGREIAADVGLLTRQEGEDYMKYLIRVYQDLRCAQAKAGDAKSNQMSVWSILDQAEREKTVEKIVPKLIPQMLVWKKIGFLMYEMLLYGFREMSGNEMDREVRSPTRDDLKSFRVGYKIIDAPRSYSYRMIDELPSSGMPVITFFTGGKKLEAEISFCQFGEAAEIFMTGFGKNAAIALERKLIPWRLDRSLVVSIDGVQLGELEKCAKKCTQEYDRRLNSGELLSIFRGFDRLNRAEAAREHWKKQLGSEMLNKFELQKMKRW